MSQLCRVGKTKAVLLGGFSLVLTLAGPPAHGQNASQAVDRAQLLRTPATLREEPAGGDDSGDNNIVSTPNDPDLGEQAILKRAETYQPFTIFASMPISYTSNVALSRSGEEGDALFTPIVGFSYVPKLTNTLYANFGFTQQFFYYNEFGELDFASLDVRAGLTYSVPRLHNLLLRGGYDFNRLTSGDHLGAEFFTNHAIELGAEVPFRIGRAQQISVGVDLSFSLAADPDEPARHDYSAFVGYSVNLTRALTLGAVGRLAVRDYVEGDRTDVSGILAVNATYRISQWLSANAISTFATNDSNQDVFDYDVFNIGGALSFTLRF
jgi:hypothetical protein